MADELKSYPPTPRQLGRLWAAGITPASQALVATAVLGTAALGIGLGWSWCVDRGGALLRTALDQAGYVTAPDQAAKLAVGIAVRAGAVVAVSGAALLVVAVLAHQLQLAPRGSPPEAAPSQGPSGWTREAAVEGSWLAACALLTVVGVVVAGRTALAGAPYLMLADAHGALSAAWLLASSVALRLLAALLGVGLLDLLVRRRVFLNAAYMSRWELAEELRMTEGHPVRRGRGGRPRRGEKTNVQLAGRMGHHPPAH